MIKKKEYLESKKFLQSSALVSVLSLFVSFINVFRDFLIAYYFGSSHLTDAYWLASVAPIFLFNVFSSITTVVFVPMFIQVSQDGLKNLYSFFFHIFKKTVFFISLISVAVSLVFFSYFFWSESFSEVTFVIFALLLFGSIIQTLSHLFKSLFLSRRKYFKGSVSSFFSALVTVTILVFFQNKIGIYAIPISFIFSYIFEFFLVLFIAFREGVFSNFNKNNFHNKKIDLSTKKFIINTFFAVLFMYLALTVDQLMARSLGDGAITLLTYGNKMSQFLMGVLGTGIGVVALSEFSLKLSSKDFIAAQKLMKKISFFVFLLTVPVVLLGVAVSEPLLSFVFKNSKLTESDLLVVSSINQIYLIQLIPYLVSLVGVRFIYATKKIHLIMKIGIVNLFTNILGNLIFMKWIGLEGIALSTVIVYLVSGILIFYFVSRIDFNLE